MPGTKNKVKKKSNNNNTSNTKKSNRSPPPRRSPRPAVMPRQKQSVPIDFVQREREMNRAPGGRLNPVIL